MNFITDYNPISSCSMIWFCIFTIMSALLLTNGCNSDGINDTTTPEVTVNDCPLNISLAHTWVTPGGMELTGHPDGTLSEDGVLLPNITWSATDRFYLRHGRRFSQFSGMEEHVHRGAAYRIQGDVLYFNRSTKTLAGSSETIYGTWYEFTYIRSTSGNDMYTTEAIDCYHFNEDGSITVTIIETEFDGETYSTSQETEAGYSGSFTLDGDNRVRIDWGRGESAGEQEIYEYEIFCNHLCLAKEGGTEVAWEMAAP